MNIFLIATLWVLVAGTIVTFLALSKQRHLTADDHYDDYSAIEGGMVHHEPKR